jgi:hypothetical protein
MPVITARQLQTQTSSIQIMMDMEMPAITVQASAIPFSSMRIKMEKVICVILHPNVVDVVNRSASKRV